MKAHHEARGFSPSTSECLGVLVNDATPRHGPGRRA